MPPFLIPWLARWAAMKAIGWAGAGRWALQTAKGWSTGSWAWAIAAVLGIVLAIVVARWFDAAPTTYTAAEVNADRMARELAMTKRAVEEKDKIIAERNRAAAIAEDLARGLDDENRKLRESANGAAAGGGGFDDADQWLLAKRRRAAERAGQARAR